MARGSGTRAAARVFAGAMLALVTAFVAMPVRAAGVCAARSGVQTVPLVELYTSEGCSSCPPADRWLSSHARDPRANYLAFHVDYWDAIGWADRFASPAYSLRQRDRVSGAGSSAVFTPQVMVGSRVQANWHVPSAFRAALTEASPVARVGLALRATPGASPALVVSATTPAAAGKAPPEQLWVARYVDAQVSRVAAGENRGATLHHDRVVRKLYGPWPLMAGVVTQRIVLDAETSPNGVVAFVQSARGDVLQSLGLPLDGCVAD